MTIINPNDTHWTVTIEGSLICTENLRYDIDVYIPIEEIENKSNSEVAKELGEAVLKLHGNYGFRVFKVVLHMLDNTEWTIYEV